MNIHLKSKGEIKWSSKDNYIATGVSYCIDNNYTVNIPNNFNFNGSSVPNIAKIIGIDDDDYLYCALLHDYLYTKHSKIIIMPYTTRGMQKVAIKSNKPRLYVGYCTRLFADQCYKDSLMYGDWIKNRLSKRKIWYSYIVLIIFGGFSFRKKNKTKKNLLFTYIGI